MFGVQDLMQAAPSALNIIIDKASHLGFCEGTVLELKGAPTAPGLAPTELSKGSAQATREVGMLAPA